MNARAICLIVAGLVIGWSAAKAQRSALDPVRVAPHIFELLLENERVRVLKATERNGETAPLHSLRDRVTVYLSPCAWMERTAGATPEMQSFRLGDVQWHQAGTRGGETSTVIQDCSRLEIELR